MARYELFERIGVGSMAEIFRGIATAGGGFQKPVAIKRILPHLSKDERFINLLIAEAKILSELHHRNIVQIYDVGLGDDGQYFLVMELIDGTDLSKIYENLFDGKRLPVEVALHLCSELCEALHYAHIAKNTSGASLSLVHRDVSPSNVLLSKAGEVKLTDFGIAKRLDEVTGHGGVRGKFAYISPEQAVSRRVDARSDVYSVGILLYELVCGHRLFSKLADFDALCQVREGNVHTSALAYHDVAKPLASLIMKALSKDPADRFQSAGDFGSALRDYRYSLPTELGDPAAAIAELAARAAIDHATEFDTDPDGDFMGASTVVRINTAEQFRLDDLSGLHRLVSSFPEPAIGASPKAGFSDASLPRPKKPKKRDPKITSGQAATSARSLAAPSSLPSEPLPPSSIAYNMATDARRRKHRIWFIAASLVVLAIVILGQIYGNEGGAKSPSDELKSASPAIDAPSATIDSSSPLHKDRTQRSKKHNKKNSDTKRTKKGKQSPPQGLQKRDRGP